MYSTEIPRLHQSIGKLLLSESPAVAKKAFEEGITTTRAMQRGTLVDQLLFGGADYEVVEPRLKSGKRVGEVATDWKGTEAKEMREAIAKRGNRTLAVLPSELERARALAGGARARLLEQGLDLNEAKCERQRVLQWTGVTANEGTPDVIVTFASGRIDTIDAKVTDANPERLYGHIYEQGWHIQGAAYQEACDSLRGSGGLNFGRHWILAIDEKHDCVSLVPLSNSYMEIGRDDWRECQEIWARCWRTGVWPEYSQAEAIPPRWVMQKRDGR